MKSNHMIYLETCRNIIDEYIKAEEAECHYTMDINKTEFPSSNTNGQSIRRKFKYVYHEYDRKHFKLLFDIEESRDELLTSIDKNIKKILRDVSYL